MSNLQIALGLQSAALSILWLLLLGLTETQPLVLVSLPLLTVVRLWSPRGLKPKGLKQRKFRQRGLKQKQHVWTNAVALTLSVLLLILMPLDDRSNWLANCSNLLWLFTGLKLLEMHERAAIRRNGLLLLIAIGIASIFTSNLGSSLLQAAASLLAVSSLLALEMGAASHLELIRRTWLLVGVSLPLMVAMFLLTPRLRPLWHLQTNRGLTGLSDQLDPGSIATLARSNATVMGLQFEGMAAPPAAERYWRVMALSRFDGRRWSASPSQDPLVTGAPVKAATSQPQLLVMLEPTNLDRLPWQGRGLPWPVSIRRNQRGELRIQEPLHQRSLYKLISAGTDAPQPWRELLPKPSDLALPTDLNPRLLKLGRQWQQLAEPEQRLQAARHWFGMQGFRYTLAPGRLPKTNALDAFLFETRAGFCEHYAASFSALMRAANVPARVVVGYQGGEWIKPLAGKGNLVVSQADAHAWSEVWLPGEGWSRVDPTAWVAPSRTTQNLYNSLAAAGSRADQGLLRLTPSWLQWMKGQWQGLDLRWHIWVMQFDQAHQEALLWQLFGNDYRRWQGAFLMGSTLLMLVPGLLVLQWLKPNKRDPLRRELDRCLNHLGVRQPQGQSLEACLQQLKQNRPDLADPLEQLTQSYLRQRFDPEADIANQRHLRSSLQTLRRVQPPRDQRQ